MEEYAYVLTYSPHYHWIEFLTLFSEKLPRLFDVKRSETLIFKNNFTALFYFVSPPSHRSLTLHPDLAFQPGNFLTHSKFSLVCKIKKIKKKTHFSNLLLAQSILL